MQSGFSLSLARKKKLVDFSQFFVWFDRKARLPNRIIPPKADDPTQFIIGGETSGGEKHGHWAEIIGFSKRDFGEPPREKTKGEEFYRRVTHGLRRRKPTGSPRSEILSQGGMDRRIGGCGKSCFRVSVQTWPGEAIPVGYVMLLELVYRYTHGRRVICRSGRQYFDCFALRRQSYVIYRSHVSKTKTQPLRYRYPKA